VRRDGLPCPLTGASYVREEQGTSSGPLESYRCPRHLTSAISDRPLAMAQMKSGAGAVARSPSPGYPPLAFRDAIVVNGGWRSIHRPHFQATQLSWEITAFSWETRRGFRDGRWSFSKALSFLILAASELRSCELDYLLVEIGGWSVSRTMRLTQRFSENAYRAIWPTFATGHHQASARPSDEVPAAPGQP